MIEIKPRQPVPADLPEPLHKSLEADELLFMGMHVLLRLHDPIRQIRYYHTLPIGHARQFPVTFSEDGREHYTSAAAELWLARPLRQSLLQPRTVNVPVQKITYSSATKVILLNCLDNCYGHMLYKLFNAQQHLAQSPDFGLIVLVPTSLVWLVPEGVAAIWHVDLPPSQLNAWITSLDGFIKEQLPRFEAVYLSPASLQLDLGQIRVEDFTRQLPFSPGRMGDAPTQIAFICREDRFWLTHPLDQWLYLASRKFRITRYLKGYFTRKQNRKIRRTAHLIGHQLGTVAFSAVGIGKTGSLGKHIEDQRVAGRVPEDTEHRWCRLYAQSHLVIGVHGSNMLLPSALSAGFINLLPDYKIPHQGEDVFPHPARLSRFLPWDSSPRQVARHAVVMLQESFG